MKAHISKKAQKMEEENPGSMDALTEALIENYGKQVVEFEFNGKRYIVSRKRIMIGG